MRIHNFGAGPSTLPLDVLEEARQEWLDFQGTGMSLVELSHRSKAYGEIHREALGLAREVSGAPADFDVLVIQGGATLQFAMAPMNLLPEGRMAGYVVSGSWAKKALADARRVAEVYSAWDGAGEGFIRMPDPLEVEVRAATTYLHVTSNETIEGIRMVDWPQTGVPLVVDMSSDYLARPVPWDLVDVVYGGAQKNLGPAGMALVFVRSSSVPEGVARSLPGYLSYRWFGESDSLGNTPPMFSVYLMGKVLRRIRDRGGIPGLERETAEKAELIYGVIDGSDGFYRCPADKRHRSQTNVVFRLPDEEIERRFLQESTAAGFVGLAGHRSVGGCRASLYAGLEMSSAEALAEFMEGFRRATRG